jgi:hypothetical protein
MDDKSTKDRELEERETAAQESAAMSARPDSAVKKPDDWSMV